MRVALAAEVGRTHEELVERILHAGLAYTDTVDRETSLVDLQRRRPRAGQGLPGQAAGGAGGVRRRVHGVRRSVVGGTGMEEFTDVATLDEQLALF